jgi:hypothetical protein
VSEVRAFSDPPTGCGRPTSNCRTCRRSRGLDEVHTASPARRMVQSGAWSDLLELKAVSERVERVEPQHTLYFVIRARRLVPRQSNLSFNDIEVLHDERRVCLAGGSKVRLDAKVKDGSTSCEPAHPAPRVLRAWVTRSSRVVRRNSRGRPALRRSESQSGRGRSQRS